jgi:hypothetical protein
MSLPNFDSAVTLPSPPEPGVANVSQNFLLSGPLGVDDEDRFVYVFVALRQTPKDLESPLDNPGPIAIAKAACDPVTVPAKFAMAKWQADVTVPVGQTQFEPGFATGTALAVEYSDNGFETYFWTQRLKLAIGALPEGAT